MTRYELHDERSHKFWQIDRDGLQVTVMFGRIGTNGQTQQKSFPTEAAATAHLDKLVLEKTRKGYLEAGRSATAAPTETIAPAAEAPASADEREAAADEGAGGAVTAAMAQQAAPPAPSGPSDEDAWSIPPEWLPRLHPRRGGAAVPEVPVQTTASDRLAGALDDREAVLTIAADPRSDQDLAHALQDASSIEFAAMAISAIRYRRDQDLAGEALADALIAARGLIWAAQCVAAMGGIALRYEQARYGSTRAEEAAAQRWAERVQPTEDLSGRTWLLDGMAARVRLRLTQAAPEQYAAAIAALEPFRSWPLATRTICSYLLPTRTDWVEEDVTAVAMLGDRAGRGLRRLLACCVTTVEHLDAITAETFPSHFSAPDQLYTVIDGIGPAVAPVLATWLGAEYIDADERRDLLDALAHLPTDEAFSLLIDRLDHRYVQRALGSAAHRFPIRAARLLSPASCGSSAKAKLAADALRTHLVRDADAIAASRGLLPADAIERINQLSPAPRLPDAEASQFPAFLITPPWEKRRSAPKPVVLTLSAPSEIETAWLPGEQQRWEAGEPGRYRHRDDWARVANELAAGTHRGWYVLDFFANAPLELTEPLLGRWSASVHSDFNISDKAQRVVARYRSPDAYQFALRCARAYPAKGGSLILPFVSTEIAVLAADWLARLKSARPHATAWLRRHAPEAAAALIPNALGKPGAARVAAAGALRWIAAQHGIEIVEAAAAAYGEDARNAMHTILETDPLDLLPARVPQRPSWIIAELLPQLRLRDGSGTALPAAASETILTMLSISQLGEPYAGLEPLSQLCEPADLAAFARELLVQWRAQEYPSQQAWILDAQGLLGDDETARMIAPLIRVWPGESAHKRAVRGLDVLLAIGTDVALMQLHGISQRVKFKGLKENAIERIAQLADDLGLTTDQLGDRLVPDLGLDAAGTTVLDFGDRRFTVGFDEQLRPVLTDQDGKPRKTLPKPSTEQGVQEAARFAALKKDVRTVASDQLTRFERGMVAQRTWTLDDFTSYLLRHPLVWHLVRRLVWTADNGAFRVAEDRSFTDVNDETFLPDGSIRIAHPLTLGAEVAAWSELFADYEILQPFPQLGRDVHRADEASRFAGVTVPTGKVMGLERRGWRRGAAADGGVQGEMEWTALDGRTVELRLDPGIVVGMIGEFPEQTLAAVDLAGLDPITVSEIVRDLASLI